MNNNEEDNELISDLFHGNRFVPNKNSFSKSIMKFKPKSNLPSIKQKNNQLPNIQDLTKINQSFNSRFYNLSKDFFVLDDFVRKEEIEDKKKKFDQYYYINRKNAQSYQSFLIDF